MPPSLYQHLVEIWSPTKRSDPEAKTTNSKRKRFSAEVIINRPAEYGIGHCEKHFLTKLPLDISLYELKSDLRAFDNDYTTVATLNGSPVKDDSCCFEELGVHANDNVIVKIGYKTGLTQCEGCGLWDDERCNMSPDDDCPLDDDDDYDDIENDVCNENAGARIDIGVPGTCASYDDMLPVLPKWLFPFLYDEHFGEWDFNPHKDYKLFNAEVCFGRGGFGGEINMKCSLSNISIFCTPDELIGFLNIPRHACTLNINGITIFRDQFRHSFQALGINNGDKVKIAVIQRCGSEPYNI